MALRHILLIFSFLISPEVWCQGRIISTAMYAPTTSAKAKSYYNEAHDAMEKHDFRSSIQLLKLAIGEDSEYIDAYDNLGLSYRQLDMLDSAEYYYLLSVRKYPKGTVARRNLAVVEEKKGHFDKAERYYKEVISIDSKDPEGYYGLMRIYFGQNKFDAALENGKKAEQYYAERNDPYIGDCYIMLCVTHIMMNNIDVAKQYLKKAQNKGVQVPSQILDALKG